MGMLKIGLAAAALAAALALALGAAAVWLFQTRGIYHFDPDPRPPAAFGLEGTRAVLFRSADGQEIRAFLRPPAPGRPVILSFHGNGAGIGPSFRRLSALAGAGYGLVMMEYRGAGATPGPSREALFAADARALYDGLDALLGETVSAERRILHGFSLGVGVGSRLAAERPFAAVILEASFPRACVFYARAYWGLPLCRLMWAERYDVVDHLAGITVPKLFVHGSADAVVPADWGRALHDAASAPKAFVLLEGGGHADLTAHGLVPAMLDFLAANGL